MAQESLTGYRKYRSPDVANINARTPFLSSIYGQKKEDKYRDQSYELQQQGLKQEEQFAQENFDLAKDAQKQAKKRDKLAATLGYTGLGLQAGFGVLNNADTLAGMFSGGGAVEPVLSGFGADAFMGPGDFAGDFFGPAVKETAFGSIGESIGGGIFDGLLGDIISGDLFGGLF